MKKLICIAVISFLLATGCKKDDPIPSGVTLPFENDNLKMELVTSSAPTSIRDIFFFNSSTGVAATYEGEIYKTTDSGVNWNLQHSNPAPDQPLYQIYFSDANVGYIVGGSISCVGSGCIPPGGLILKTTDGGNTWITVFQQPRIEFVSIAANSSGDLFTISKGTKGMIYKSSNAGINWTIVDSFDFKLEKITFSNSFGFCTGMDGKIIRSNDNGITWKFTTTLSANYTTDIKFSSGSGYCIANNQTVYKTTDNGNNWLQKFNSDYGSFVLNPLTTSSCLVFGAGKYSGGDFGTYDGAVTQTTNGGDDWTDTEISDIESIRSTSFYSSINGYVVAGTKLIKVTVK